MPDTHKIAAQVVLATPAADGRVVTAQNIHGVLPSREDAERAVSAFSALGFTIGPVVGNSFSIEADAQVFRQVFGVSLTVERDGTVHAKGTKRSQDSPKPLSSLPVEKLPSTLRTLVQAVVFSEPPAFGPGTLP